MAIKELLEQNTDVVELATSLLAELNDREGQYVWKKYEYYGFTAEVTSYNPCIMVIHSECGDLSKVDESFFVDWTFVRSSGAKIILHEGGQGETVTTTGGTGDAFTWSYDPSTQTITTTKTYTSDGEMTVIPTSAPFDYVVADSKDTYPNIGVQDGCWYELFDPTTLIAENIREGVDIWGVIGAVTEGIDLPSLFGLTKIAIDTFTVTDSKAIKDQAVTHSLKQIPKVAMIVAPNPTTNNDLKLGIVCNLAGVSGTVGQAAWYWLYDTSTGGRHSTTTVSSTIDSSSITISASGTYYRTGIQYYVITMA